jgi:DNA-binding NtrC family response regulator
MREGDALKGTADPEQDQGRTAAPLVAAKIAVVHGPDRGLEILLDRSIELGSDPACDLVLHDAAVSRRHAVLLTVGGRIRVRDLGSRNGTFLGGTRLVDAEVPLGAVLTVGNSQVALQSRRFVSEVAPSSERAFGDLIGESLAMREVFAILERVSRTDVTVLIEGESGTGKEPAARSIHRASLRAARPYVVFDCGAVPRELAEAELFGHKRGSFTSAFSSRAGGFGQADGGTLCLDEVGELPLDLQPKMLRAIETGEIRAVGEDVARKVDVRLIASTNRDLHAEVLRGRFRADLFYRLSVVRIRMPPLRERPEDIAGLVGHFVRDQLPSGDVPGGENLARLMAYSWPGNVRELRNALARAVALARQPSGGPVAFSSLVFNPGPAEDRPGPLATDFPGVAAAVPYGIAKQQVLARFDRAYVGALLQRHRGNVTRAAAAASLSRKHLYQLLRRITGADD